MPYLFSRKKRIIRDYGFVIIWLSHNGWPHNICSTTEPWSQLLCFRNSDIIDKKYFEPWFATHLINYYNPLHTNDSADQSVINNPLKETFLILKLILLTVIVSISFSCESQHGRHPVMYCPGFGLFLITYEMHWVCSPKLQIGYDLFSVRFGKTFS